MPQVQAVIAGRLTIGEDIEGRIKSPLETDEQINDYAESVKANVVKADRTNCAVCMDGRCAYCTAADLRQDGSLPETKVTPEVLPEMAGGLYDMATTSALLAGWSGFGPEVDSYEKAYKVVSVFLDGEGFEDGGHTTNLSYLSEDNTECGAWMKKQKAMAKGAAAYQLSSASGIPSPLDGAVNGLNGYADPSEIMSNPSYKAVRANQARLVESGFFGTFDPVAHLRDLMSRKPKNVELLISDPESPTHGHKEPALVVNEIEGYTIDRDAMGLPPFVDDRWLRRQVAHLMGTSAEEQERLLIAGDVVTADVSDELLAPGLPVIVLKAA